MSTIAQKEYIVALEVGGTMEQPHFTYENKQTIKAHSAKEAENIYNKLNNCSYFYGRCIGDTEKGVYVFDEEYKGNSFS